MEIYINLKSGNPVTIIKNSEHFSKWTKGMTPVKCVTTQRIDSLKQMISPISALQPLDDFIKNGGELSSSDTRLIEFMMRGQ